MPAFDLPEFYTPFPVRVNPHLDGARRDSKAWARRMGMLDLEPHIWDEQRFDAADYALNISMRFPDASPPELGLVTAWNVWGF
jgi:germacradienol/geosmin synthase